MSVIDRIKNILNLNKDISDEENDSVVLLDDLMVNNISFGDVILAKRYDSEAERENFLKGHETGLYVVVGKDKNKLICCYCTSVKGKKGFFPICENYRVLNNKETYATVFKIKTIDNYSFMRKVGEIDSDDKQKIIKKLLFHNSIYNDNGRTKKLNITFEPNINTRDIIEIDNVCYLIIDVNGSNMKLLRIDNYDKDNYLIDFTKVDIDYNEIFMDKSVSYNYINTITRMQFMIVMKEYLKNKKRITEFNSVKDNNNLKRGCIVKYDDKLYYVYNICESLADAFEIVEDGKNGTLLINKKRFKAYYENEVDIIINDTSYTVIDMVSDKEKDLISSDRKKYFNNKKMENKELVKRKKGHNFNVGDIIESTEIYGMKFIVIGMYKDTIITISLDHFIDDNKVIYREFSNYNGSLDLSNNINKELLAKVRENIIYFDALSDEVKFKKRKREKKK